MQLKCLIFIIWLCIQSSYMNLQSNDGGEKAWKGLFSAAVHLLVTSFFFFFLDSTHPG